MIGPGYYTPKDQVVTKQPIYGQIRPEGSVHTLAPLNEDVKLRLLADKLLIPAAERDSALSGQKTLLSENLMYVASSRDL